MIRDLLRRRIMVTVIFLGTAVAATLFAFGRTGSAEASKIQPPPTDVVSALHSDYQIVVIPAREEELTKHGIAPASLAIETSGGEFAFAGGEPPSAYLVRFTDLTYGEPPSEGGAVAPAYVKKLAWLVVTRNTTHFVFGPFGRVRHPGTYTATLATFVDAMTGEFLGAATT